jgi:hypothetical protein
LSLGVEAGVFDDAFGGLFGEDSETWGKDRVSENSSGFIQSPKLSDFLSFYQIYKSSPNNFQMHHQTLWLQYPKTIPSQTSKTPRVELIKNESTFPKKEKSWFIFDQLGLDHLWCLEEI